MKMWSTRLGKEHAAQFSLVSQWCLTLCDPMNCSTLGFPVHHQLPKLAQAHVHWVSDAIPRSHPLSSPSPPAFNLSQHQGFSQWVSSSHQMAEILEPQQQPFQWIFKDWFSLGLTGLVSLLPKGHWRVFSSTTVQKCQFFITQPSS